MQRLARRPALMVLLLAVTCGVAPVRAQTAPAVAPIPEVTGPIAVTATAVPLMMSSRLQTVVDLPKAGYVEEEFFLAGRANVYDWSADGQPVAKTPNAPYTTRLMLRRPADAGRFSGTVIVEIVNSARRYDFPFAWGVSHDHFMGNGDAFAMITLAQANLEGLKAFDPMRYAPLALANPTPDETCTAGRVGGPPQIAPGEEGLQFDILAQAGALLKAGRATGPLGGFRVQRLYMIAYDGALPTYIAAVHSRVRLTGGAPIYDGYILNRHPALTRLRRCGAAPAAGDPRQILRNLDVPLMRIIGQTDILATYTQRREDSDAPGDRYRLYEIAGGAHADAAFYPYIPAVADLRKIGSPYPFLASWPFANQCEPEQTLAKTPINTYALDAALANLTRWVRDGVPPPKAERIKIENPGTPQARIAVDQFGNAIGGVRSPYLDVPTASYFTTSKGETFCPELAHTVPFDWARLNSLYGTPQNYRAKVAQSVDRLVRERWLTESDGRRIKAEAGSVQVSSSN
ncbi:MAG TPA: alpha/beta hydrolase domain-containing protein [Vicinamibacterales bacterium]|nr:alpha/beta hydrolase domain-containing protein [Vicinamibacterales bacterium]